MVMHPNVATLLRAHGVAGDELPLTHDGFSGARITSIQQGDERYILKRLRREDDWIMRATDDVDGREAQFAASPIVARLPASISIPSLGAARDGDGWAVLMRDISAALLPDDLVLTDDELDIVLSRLAEMHAAFWDDPMDDAGVAWCGARERLSILTPAVGSVLVTEGRDFGIERGWQVFDCLAAHRAVRLVRALQDDLSPLLAIIDAMPETLLHGDVKFSNIGLANDTLHLFDWAVVMHGPIALEIGWIPGVNARRVRDPFAVIDRYGEHLERALGGARLGRAEWAKQCAVAHIALVLLLGWAKALDAEGGRPEELQRWCELAVEGASTLGLT